MWTFGLLREKWRNRGTVSYKDLILFPDLCFSAGWVDCVSTSYVSLTICYTYHPMPLIQRFENNFLTVDGLPTHDLEEAMLSPLRPDKPGSSRSKRQITPDTFDGSEWDPDEISVELEVAPSVLCLYGSLFRNFLHVKVRKYIFCSVIIEI